MRERIVILKDAVQTLNEAKITNHKKAPRKALGDYNCWGFTSWLLEWEKRLRWVPCVDMEYNLERFSKPVKRGRKGDVVVYKNSWGRLLHTAIIIGRRTIIHKNGGLPIEITGINDTMYGEPAEIRRSL